MQRLQLYRRVLKLHRAVLPPDLRRLGDAYVHEEFVKHRKADQSFVDKFTREWVSYADTLEKQKQQGAVRGRDLEEEKVAKLSDAQLKQLALLRRESTRSLKGEENGHAHGAPGHVHGPGCKH